MAYLFLVFLVCCMDKFILTSFHWVCLSGFPPQEVGGGTLYNPTWGSSFQNGHLFQASKACKREEISQVKIYKRVVGNLIKGLTKYLYGCNGTRVPFVCLLFVAWRLHYVITSEHALVVSTTRCLLEPGKA